MSYKVVFLGEGRVGKTSIGKRWVEGNFDNNKRPTISAACFQKTIQIGTRILDIQLWDTAGQEEYHSLAPIYYKGASVAILVFSVIDQKSFDKMIQWRKELLSSSESNIKIIIVGNKIDLESLRAINRKQGELIAQQNNCNYFEVSAKTGEGVENLFIHLGELLMDIPISEIGPTRKSKSLVVTDIINDNEKKSCC